MRCLRTAFLVPLPSGSCHGGVHESSTTSGKRVDRMSCFIMQAECDLPKVVPMNTCKEWGKRLCEYTEKNRNINNLGSLLRELQFSPGYSRGDIWQVTRKTEHAGKLKPFEQRDDMSDYVTRKTEHGGRLKPPHRVGTKDRLHSINLMRSISISGSTQAYPRGFSESTLTCSLSSFHKLH